MREREELHAAIEARRELGDEYERQLVDSFVERIERRLEERASTEVVPRDRQDRAVTPLVLGSLGLSIPLIAIAGGVSGLPGIALVCLAIVLVNLLAALRR